MLQRTASLSVLSFLLACAAVAPRLCNAQYHDEAKVTFTVEVPMLELDDVRRFVHELSVKWNVRNDDASYKFAPGYGYILNTLMQRPDGLKARFLGGTQTNAQSLLEGSQPHKETRPSVRLSIACDPPCKEWQPFAKALEAEVSHHWKISIYDDPARAPSNNRWRGP